MGSRGKEERPKALQTNPPGKAKSLTFPVDRENGMKNGADLRRATLLSDCLVAGHGPLLISTSGLSLVIPDRSRHDAAMTCIFLRRR